MNTGEALSISLMVTEMVKVYARRLRILGCEVPWAADALRLSRKSTPNVSTGLCVDEVDVVTWRLLCKDDVGQSIPYIASSHARQGGRTNWQNM